MTVTIRKIEKTEDEYIAYAKSMCGKATYFLYFVEGIWGAVVLCNFVQMLKNFFEPEKLKISVHENAVSLKNSEILTLLQEYSSDKQNRWSISSNGERIRNL